MSTKLGLASIIGWLAAMTIFLVHPLDAQAREEKLTRFTLPNGLTVIIQEDHARKVATLQYWVLVGGADENDAERGISHLIEHMAFKGTERRGVGKVASEIEALGGEINAYTSWDQTVFHVTVPSNKTVEGLDILTDAVMRPIIDPGELDKEKQVVIEEILEGEERPERVASKLLFENAYVKSPYRYPVIGYRKTVEGFTRDDIIAFRKKWYAPENMFLLIVGDVNPQELRGEIERMNADLKPFGFFRPPRAMEPPQTEIRSSLVRDDKAKETRLHIAFHVPSIESNDVNALDVTADILGARESSRLVRVLKKDKKLVNSISAYAITPRFPGLMVISATLDANNLEAATRAITEEIAGLAKTPPSSEELQRAKVHIESNQIYSRETVQGTAREIGSYMADLGDPQYDEKYLKLNAAVTSEQVSDVVKRYMRAPNVTISVLLPGGSDQSLSAEPLKKILASDSPEDKSQAKEVSSGKAVISRTLPNGIRVVILPDDSNPAVSFRIVFLGGKRFENKSNEGIMNFIAQMLTKGTSAMNEVQIARKVEDMGGRLSGFSGYDSFGFSATFFSRYLDDGLQLLGQLFTDPAFPQDKLEREKALIINRIKTQPDRPVQYAINILNETFFGSHPYGFDKDGTVATVSALTVDDLKQTYQRFAVPSNMVITAVGDLDPDKTLEKITEVFGKIPAKQLDAPKVPAEAPLTGVREKVVLIPRAKAHLSIGFPGTTFSSADRYPMEVLSNILSGQGGRLFLQLRDKESLAYSVTSFVRSGVDPGVFAFYMACDESKADRGVQGLFEEIERVRTGNVSENEIDRAINNLVGNHLIALQSSWSRAENMALNTLYGLGYDYDAEYIKKISEVKTEDVLRVAKKYLDPARCAIVKILPKKEEKQQG
jgi:zinc protease